VADQQPDGSWFGRWGIAQLYGPWAALSGMAAVATRAVDVRGSRGLIHVVHRGVRRGVAWLVGVQSPDGGFGESAASDLGWMYVPVGGSVPSQTAWGALALMAVAESLPTGAEGFPLARHAAARAVGWLLDRQSADGGWQESDPTGAGFAGKIYLRYHFYPLVWPMRAPARAARQGAAVGPKWPRVHR
jgi:sporulenol synthase